MGYHWIQLIACVCVFLSCFWLNNSLSSVAVDGSSTRSWNMSIPIKLPSLLAAKRLDRESYSYYSNKFILLTSTTNYLESMLSKLSQVMEFENCLIERVRLNAKSLRRVRLNSDMNSYVLKRPRSRVRRFFTRLWLKRLLGFTTDSWYFNRFTDDMVLYQVIYTS